MPQISKPIETPFDPDLSDAKLLGWVVEYYHEQLLKSQVAIDYLEKRGLYDLATIKRVKIGFGDRSLGLRLPPKSIADGKAIRERLQQLGIIRKSGHEHFNGSVVVPILDADGNVCQMYGRKVTPNLRKGTPLHLYLSDEHKGVWNPEALHHPEIILCEAPLDALSFAVNGFDNVTFTYGTDGFTDELFDELLTHNVRSVRLAYDNDVDGYKAVERDARRLLSVGIDVYRIKLPHGMDVNEYALKMEYPDKALRDVLNRAECVGGVGVESSVSVPEVAIVESPESSKPIIENTDLIQRGEYYFLLLGQREYRVGGLTKNNSLDILKITLRMRHGDNFHLDNLDLTKDSDRRRFIDRAHEETRLEKPLIKRDLGKLLLSLEEVQLDRINAILSSDNAPEVPELSDDERTEALSFLRSPNLIQSICEAFDRCGLVGEDTNRLAAYLACTSRKLSRPLAVIVQSTSAAGKSTLMESVLSMFPNESQVKYSAMTGQSLYYLGETNLKHRILAIVEEEGAQKASYALKLLQSEGELTIASTGKDPNTGRMETQEYRVEGPVMIFLTTTSINIDEELQNRCLTLSVDESKEQTERIHQLQRKSRTLEGLKLKKERKRVLELMRNIQRLIEPVDVVNPYADHLTFTSERTRTRRDHEKYLTLIDTIALLHQHQRPIKQLDGGTHYIEVHPSDIELANKLAPELLSRSLDELPPQTRRVHDVAKVIVKNRMESQEVEQELAWFSRREIREYLGWSATQIRIHLERLRDMEYLRARHGRSGTKFQYELLIDVSEETNATHTGLIDTSTLKVRHKPDGVNVSLSGG